MSVDASQVSWTEKDDVAVPLRLPGTLGGVVSPPGPSRLVPKAASSKTTSQVPFDVSPICSVPIGAVPRFAPLKVRSGTAAPSSHTSTTPLLMERWSSSTCQAPCEGVTGLVVEVPAASLNWSFPPLVRAMNPPFEPPDVSRSRSSVTWEFGPLTLKAILA